MNDKNIIQLSGGGLSQSIVLRRQEEEGYNELPQSRPKRTISIVINILKEPTVYILLGCGAIYFLIGDRQEAMMLMGFLVLIIGITVTQEAKAERALEALKDLSSPRALVLRDGAKLRIAGREVVRGDILFINEGDRVPADSTLISGDYISSDESLLTGEAIPVDKKKDSKIFAGATIVRGQGIALVTAIGAKTEIGKIGKSIQGTEAESTNLEKQTTGLVKQVTWVAALLCVLVVVVYALTRENWLEGALVGLSLAMAIMPNELPAVLAIFLSLGAWRLSQRRVLTRKLSAVENLGAVTVLCVDKTGTLTLNQMTIQKIYSQGRYVDLLDSKTNSLDEEFHEALEFGILASRKDPYDPMELAFVSAGSKFLQGTEHLHHDWSLKKEYPLSSELLSITHAWKPKIGGGFVVGAKGAPEAIIDLCHMSKENAEAAHKAAETMASEGLRVLGVAKASSDQAALPMKQHDFEFVFVGFIGLIDPVRSEVPNAVSECHKAGIRVVMITGDHPTTACSIARKIGLENPDLVMTGSEMEKVSDIDLGLMAKKISVFSRVMPEQKLRLVNCLKSAGEVVAMTGDGVNDAPALKSADIGIAMGGRGTDVARESADLVLLDDDFASIVEAIRMGRKIYSNLRSALVYLFAVHVPIAGMSIFPVFFGHPLVFFPAHIAFLHLIIEPASSIAFEAEPAGKDTMLEPPRDPQEKLLNRELWLPSITMGVSILIALLSVYYISLQKGLGEPEIRALVFTTLIISNITLIFMSRGSKSSFIQKIISKPNKVVQYIIFTSLLMLSGVLYNESLRKMFSFSYLHPIDLVICIIIGIVSVIWTEIIPKKTKKTKI
jgi:Ca2+-transporting ATPase